MCFGIFKKKTEKEVTDGAPSPREGGSAFLAGVSDKMRAEELLRREKEQEENERRRRQLKDDLSIIFKGEYGETPAEKKEKAAAKNRGFFGTVLKAYYGGEGPGSFRDRFAHAVKKSLEKAKK